MGEMSLDFPIFDHCVLLVFSEHLKFQLSSFFIVRKADLSYLVGDGGRLEIAELSENEKSNLTVVARICKELRRSGRG